MYFQSCGVSVLRLQFMLFLSPGIFISSEHIEFGSDSSQNDVVSWISDYLLNGEIKGKGYEWLANITDAFGHRIVGSIALEDAIDYVIKGLKDQNFDNVHTEEVKDLPYWVRGEEEAYLLYPRQHKMDILGLGNTVATPDVGIKAEAIVVDSFEELRQAGAEGKVSGKIVVYNEAWKDYGRTAMYRTSGAKMASQYGAVATLIRSVTSMSVYSPHTGSQSYSNDVPKIPTACITVEDAQLLSRMQKRGQKLRIYLRIKSHSFGKTTSRNTVFQLTGTTKPNEVVLISAHFDSWDVGQGAMDDGGGCAVMWQALTALKYLGLRPKRTIRVVLWTAEEPGLLGSKAYYNRHKTNTNETFVFVSESDEGVFKPTSLNATLQFRGSKPLLKKMQEIAIKVRDTGIPMSVKPTDQDLGDVEYWAKDGIPGVFYLNADMYEHYFFFHHTRADTMTVLKPEDIDYTSAIFANFAHAIANMDTI